MNGAPSSPHPALTAAAQALPGDHWIDRLEDGSYVLIRPIRPEDRERERAFIEGLSPEAQRFRFFEVIRKVSPAMLDQLVDVDEQRTEAFIALAHDNGVLREVGVSRYAATDEPGVCECAVAVADDWRHRGLGLALMRHLIDAARRNGFKRMYSIDAVDNEPMRKLAAMLGFERRPDPNDASQVIHSLTLAV